MTIDTHREERSERKLKLAIVITFAMIFIEVFGYFISNSLALLTDAGHVFLHVVALGMSLWAVKLACKPPTEKATFGHHRAEPLVALINAITILILAFVIFFEAYRRLLSPPPIRSIEMLTIAVIGLLGNMSVVVILRGPKDLNIRSAYLHVIFDTLSSFIIVFGGVFMLYTGNFLIDPMLSFFIGGLMLFSALQLARESLDILLERTPKHVNIRELKSKVCEIEGVRDLHDIHVWSLCSHLHVMSAHVLVDETHVEQTQEIIDKINAVLERQFGICHSALQLENVPCNARPGA